jgi:endonuclease/exonuclease/phosphatase family metal-dependent hydrolase
MAGGVVWSVYASMMMRLVSYNILDGGAQRAGQLADVIATANADIVALVEADDAAVVEMLAHRLEMDYVLAGGQSHAVAFLSRWPIVESVNHALLRPDAGRCLLEATVLSPAGQEWPIGVLHLTAHATEAAETERERQFGAALNAFARHRERGTPHLLCGDFNANAPTQQIDFERASPRTRREAAENGGDVPRRVIRTVLAAGYTDTLRSFAASYADATGTFKTEQPQQRVDYIFSFAVDPARIAGAWIDQSDLARSASDHFPVGVELR